MIYKEYQFSSLIYSLRDLWCVYCMDLRLNEKKTLHLDNKS